MNKTQISKFQLFTLLVIYIRANNVITGVFEEEIRQNVIFAITIGLILSIILLNIYIFLFKYINNLDLEKIKKNPILNYIIKFFLVLYTAYFILIASLNLRDIMEVVQTYLLDRADLYMLSGVLIFVVLCALLYEIEVFARVSELLFYLVIIVFLIFSAFIMMFNELKIKYFFPILQNGFLPIIKPSLFFSYAIPFGELIVFLFIFSYVNNKKSIRKYSFFAQVLTGITYITIVILNVLVLGPLVMTYSINPPVRITRRIDIGNLLQRFDLITILILVIMVFIKLTILLYASKISLKYIFNLKKAIIASILLCITTLIISIEINRNYLYLLKFRQKIVIPYINLTFEIIIPFILLIILFILKKNNALQKSTSNIK